MPANREIPTISQSELSPINRAETVRVIIRNSDGKILLLQKAPTSKNPLHYEFPGGKIDIQDPTPSREQQIDTAIKEVQEETGLDITGFPLSHVDDFSYEFKVRETLYKRNVHTFLVDLPRKNYQIVVNRTLTPEGQSEDKHSCARWVSVEELTALHKKNMLAANSSNISVITEKS